MTVLLKVMDACTAQSGDLLLGEFREEHDLSTLPQPDFAAIQILTARAFWDGPLEGILEYDGNIYWYETYFDEEIDDYPHPRPYVVAAVSAAVVQEELSWTRLFKEKVRDGKLLRPAHLHHEFYDAYQARTEPNLDAASGADRLVLPWRSAPRGLDKSLTHFVMN